MLVSVDFGDLTSDALRPDQEVIINEATGWYKQLPPAQREVVRNLDQKILDKLNGISKEGTTISYSLINKSISNRSMSLGTQFQEITDSEYLKIKDDCSKKDH